METDRDGHLILAALQGRAFAAEPPHHRGRFLWRVCEHGLAGLLADAVSRLGPAGAPALDPLLADLRANAAAQEAMVRVNLRVASEVASALEGAEIPAVWVKGVALSVTVYDRPGLRAFGDLDLLVSKRSLPKTVETLLSLGFAPDRGGPPDTMASNYARREGAGTASIDLHWDFVQRDGPQSAVRIPVEEILGRARPAGGLTVPATEDSLLLGAANLIRSRMDRLILLVDFARLAAATPDWARVRERAEAWGLKTSLWLGLAFAADGLGASVPRDVLEGLAPARWRARLLRALLSGSSFWARRKVRARAVAYGLPFLCADTAGDAAEAILRSRRRVWSRLD